MKKYTCIIMVLLSILLTACTSKSKKSEKAEDLTAETIVNEFVNNGMSVGDIIVYDEVTDKNGLLGRPNRYTSKVSFSDSRLKQEDYEDADPVGGTVEVFNNEEDAKDRYDYIAAVSQGTILEQYMYLSKNAFLRLDFSLTPSQAAEYEKIFMSIVE